MFEKVEKPFLKHRRTPHMEFELRLGKKAPNMFDTNIGKEKWERILKGLQNYKHWEDTKETRSTVYQTGDYRVVVDDESSEQDVHKKKKLQVIDIPLKDQPLDVRVSMSTEEPSEIPEDMEFQKIRERKRYSFLRKNLWIELTQWMGQAEDLDDENEIQYQVELEIDDVNKVTDDVLMKNILHKAYNVMELLV